MTRLNSTFRSGCKLDNRTIKEEKQAGKANQARKKSRNFTKQDCSFIDPGKTFVRTCKLFKTTLHERPRQDCKPTSEKAIRAMDVARQSSMEEGLQVQLLPWKEKADNLISSKSKERSPYNDEGKLPIVRGDLSSIDSNGIRNEMKINSCCQHNEGRLGQVNGVGEIEACVRSDNRMQLNAKVNEKSLESMVYSDKSAEMDANSITNGIQCDVQHLKISSNNTKETAATVFENSPVSDLKAGNVDISLVEVGWTLTNRPNPSSLHYNYKDQCVSNAGSGKTVSDETLEEVNLKNDSSGDNDDIKKKGITDTNTLDHCAKSTNTSNTCKDRKHSGSDCQTERDCELIIAIDLKEKNTNDSCKCDDSTGPASHSVIKGRPKRAARSLRSRHDDDFILDVRQIPHKFKDKITSIKKENRKNLLACGKKRKRTQKQDNKELLTEQEKSEKTEKASKLNEVVDEDKYVNVDCVLGVRHDDNNKQQVLVQFTDGTSNWIKKSEMKSPVNTLSDYFLFADQDLSAAQRLPSAWFGCHLDSWENRPLKLSDFGDCDFYQANGKKLIKCEKSKDYCSKISKRWPAQNIPSPLCEASKDSSYLCEASKDSFYLEDRFESIFDMDEKIVNQLAGERLLSNMYFSQSNRVVDCDRIPSNPIGLDSLTSSDQLNLKNDENLFQIDELSDCEPVYCKKAEEVSRPIKPRLSCRSSTTILSDGVQVFLSRNGEVEVLQSDHVEIVLRHKDKRSKRIRSETCDNLIHQLELRINDDECQFVVINGLEDYFASSMDMEKLIKFPSEAEKTKYDEKMANLRYLFQTLKNYPKPIVAVISSAATGLAAALLSLVDMVYDQSTDEMKKNGISNGKHPLPVLAPKLMGLQHKNEALIMGEFPDSQLDEQLKQVNNIFKSLRFSGGITSTLKEMRLNEKLSNERPNQRKRARQSTSHSRNSPKSPLNSQSSYAKTRFARMRGPPGRDQSETEECDVDAALREEIDKERELATQCLKELNEFWNEIADAACSQ